MNIDNLPDLSVPVTFIFRINYEGQNFEIKNAMDESFSFVFNRRSCRQK